MTIGAGGVAGIEILSSERIPEQPRVREVLLLAPTEDDVLESPVDELSYELGDEMLLPGFDLQSGLADSLRAIRAGVLEEGAVYTSSLLNPAQTWRVRSIGGDEAGYANVVVGRLGVGETAVAVSQQDLGGIEVGQEVILGSSPGSVVSRSVAAATPDATSAETGDAGPVGRETVAEVPRRRVRGSRKIRVEFVPDPHQPTIETQVWLPILRVHRPHRRGCEGKAEFEQLAGQAVEGSLNFLGMGGGEGETFRARFIAEYPADEACSEWVVEGKLSFRFGTTLVDGTDVGYGTRGDVVRTGSDLIERPISSGDDDCQRRRDDVPQELWVNMEGLDRRKARSKTVAWRWWEVERETSGKLSVGLSFGAHAPAKISLDFVRTFSTKQKAGAGLAPGARYLAYYPSSRNNFEVCWTTR